MPSLTVRSSVESSREEGLATPEARGDPATTFCCGSPAKTSWVSSESSTPDMSFIALERCARSHPLRARACTSH